MAFVKCPRGYVHSVSKSLLVQDLTKGSVSRSLSKSPSVFSSSGLIDFTNHNDDDLPAPELPTPLFFDIGLVEYDLAAWLDVLSLSKDDRSMQEVVGSEDLVVQIFKSMSLLETSRLSKLNSLWLSSSRSRPLILSQLRRAVAVEVPLELVSEGHRVLACSEGILIEQNLRYPCELKLHNPLSGFRKILPAFRSYVVPSSVISAVDSVTGALSLLAVFTTSFDQTGDVYFYQILRVGVDEEWKLLRGYDKFERTIVGANDFFLSFINNLGQQVIHIINVKTLEVSHFLNRKTKFTGKISRLLNWGGQFAAVRDYGSKGLFIYILCKTSTGLRYAKPVLVDTKFLASHPFSNFDLSASYMIEDQLYFVSWLDGICGSLNVVTGQAFMIDHEMDTPYHPTTKYL